MKVEERLVRVAACAVPESTRHVRREEWLADLDGCDELGVGSWDVALGAACYAVSARNLRTVMTSVRSRSWIVVGVATLALGALSAAGVSVGTYYQAQQRGVVTVETQRDGTETVVQWRDFPGIAGIEHSSPRLLPTVEGGLALGDQTIQHIQRQLNTLHNGDWVQDDLRPNVIERAQNGYGGMSMLYAVNSRPWLLKGDPLSPHQTQAAISTIRDIAGSYGFTDLTMESLGDQASGELRAGVLRDSHGQWLSFTVGEIPTRDSAGIDPIITLTYGSDGLLRADDSTAFTESLEPFVGYRQPAPMTS